MAAVFLERPAQLLFPPRCAVLAWLLLALAGTVHGASPEASSLAVDDGVFDLGTLRVLAEQGDKRAAFLLGTRYASGRGSVRDDSEAVRWFQQAAEGGLAEAQYNLGIMYARGRGVPLDPAQAARWYRRAAEQGLAEAQFNLGTLYGTGRGVLRNEREAAHWLEKAARRGVAPAQYNLGVLYEHGRGVRLDGGKALQWYRRAAEQGYDPARVRLAALESRLAVPGGGTRDIPAATPTPAGQAPEPVPAADVPAVPDAPESAAAGSGTDAVAIATPVPAPVAGAAPRRPDDTERGPDWVAGLDPEGYTVQLASYTSAEDARRFIEALPASVPAGFYTSTKQGRRWYSVVHGQFPSYQDAESAVKALPARLRRMKPWIRKLGLIHKAMN